MRLRRLLPAMLIALAASGCMRQTAPSPGVVAPALQGDPFHPAHAQGWVETKLYFGLGPADHPQVGVSEQEWRAFLDKEVTPRFPAGLSVVDVYGQWKSSSERTLERLRSKMLIIDYPDNAQNRKKIEDIRTAWKQRTGDRSVLEVTEPAEVSF